MARIRNYMKFSNIGGARVLSKAVVLLLGLMGLLVLQACSGSSGERRLYENKDAGISFTVPVKYRDVEEEPKMICFADPTDGASGFTLTYNNVKDTVNIHKSDYIDKLAAGFERVYSMRGAKEVKLLSKDKTSVAGQNAVNIKYSIKAKGQEGIVEICVVQRGQVVYIFEFIFSGSDYNKVAPALLKETIKSIKFI